MIDHLMREVARQNFIGKQRIRIERRTRLDVLANP
jgi:hypothetical protein